MIRRELTDAQWGRIEPLIPGKEGDRGRHGEDNRLFVDAVIWLVRAGAPWRDFNALAEDPDFEYLIIDSTIVRAHQHAAGAKKGAAKMRRSAVRAAA